MARLAQCYGHASWMEPSWVFSVDSVSPVTHTVSHTALAIITYSANQHISSMFSLPSLLATN